jgi:heptosyltransferase-1
MSKTTPLRDCRARRIALIKPSALGDIVHSLPVLTGLRQRFPAAHITWIVNRSYESLLQGHPDLDDTLPFDRQQTRSGLLQSALRFSRFLSRVRRRRFDLVIDLQGLLRTGLMALASGAARRVGLASAREGAAWCYSDLIRDNDADGLHAVDRYWRVVDALGAGDLPKRFHVPVTVAARDWAIGRLCEYPRPWLMFGVGARWLTKRWPPRHFAELGRRAQTAFGGTAVFVGAPEDRSLAHASARSMSGPALDLTGATTLPQLAAVLSLGDVMIANDTGPLHLAAALGRPVVAPYTCTKVALTGPYPSAPESRIGAVETQVWCHGSLRKTCDRMECMYELTPDRLWPLLWEVLREWQRNRLSA